MTEIKKLFDRVIRHSQYGIERPQTEKLFELWEKNKSDIIKAFNGKLIYELPEKVAFEITDEIKEQHTTDFIKMVFNYNYDDLGHFLQYERQGFFSNKVVEEYKNNDIVITKGTKLVKAFKYFIKDQEALSNMQNAASRLIQENKVEGKLCFSVHPLDYLSVSENNYNWRSCHSLDGEYRAGNLSYMMDKTTIICYLKGEDEVILPNFPSTVPWNNKKWRVLLYLSNDWRMIFAGRQYPFESNTGMDLILDILNKKFKESPRDDWYTRPTTDSFWTDWTDFKLKLTTNESLNIDFNLVDPLIPLNGKLISLYDLVKDRKGSKHFNDVINSSYYNPIYTYLVHPSAWDGDKPKAYANKNTHFEIGNYTYCLRCGDAAEVLDSSSTMMCFDCERDYGNSESDMFTFCDHCGCRLATEDSYYVDDASYCPNCYHERFAVCDVCGEPDLIGNMTYNMEDEVYICDWCHNHIND